MKLNKSEMKSNSCLICLIATKYFQSILRSCGPHITRGNEKVLVVREVIEDLNDGWPDGLVVDRRKDRMLTE